MGRTADTDAAPRPTGSLPPTGSESVGLVCNEIWGGNRAFYGPVELPGMRGVLFSQASDSVLGGDVHYPAVEPKTGYTRCLRRVAFGDRLLLLTDGVVEAPNVAGELFGRELGMMVTVGAAPPFGTLNCRP